MDGVITGAVLGMNRSNISDEDEDSSGTFGSGQSGGGGSGGNNGGSGSGDSYGTVKFFGGDEGGIEEPLLPPA